MRVNKFVRCFLSFFIGICLFFAIFIVSYIGIIYFSTNIKFDKNKITSSKLQVFIYDKDKKPLKNTYLSGQFISLSLIPNHTKQCFISIEDKDFYNHNGLNYKRMIAATAKNILTLSFKEGASTISQQLIKNTHLSRDKTINRKISEIKLTRKLESTLTKDEILEYYLNIIYFGDNCYGIQDASIHYFSHPATKLTLTESAMLAGMIKSPNKYHPIKNTNDCFKRKNLVLNQMYNDGNITKSCYEESVKQNIEININDDFDKKSDYAESAIKEAEEILKIPEKSIAIGAYRIYTYQDTYKQSALEKCIPEVDENYSMISMNAKNGHIEAYVQKAEYNIINLARQPASAIKPSLVYAPALNENIISPSTMILDENICINGYSPKNIGEKNYGYVSAKSALSNSYNIPAVKILSYVGIQKAQNYLNKQNIQFDKNDNNLAIALGGMTKGISLKQLTNTYQTFANSGKFVEAKFVEYIIDRNGKIIYKNNDTEKTIYRDDTAYLITDMLRECAKNGTAKKLKTLDLQIASKTGTSSISNNNLDAYNISYSSSDVVGMWIGNLDNSPTNIVGGGLPTSCIKAYLERIYATNKPQPFIMPNSICELYIDTLALNEEHIVYEANDFLPERYSSKQLFSRFNLPQKQCFDSITVPSIKLEASAKNGIAYLSFNAKEQYIYDIYKIIDDKKYLLDEISCKKGTVKTTYPIDDNKKIQYVVDVKIKNYQDERILEITSSNVVSLFCSK